MWWFLFGFAVGSIFTLLLIGVSLRRLNRAESKLRAARAAHDKSTEEFLAAKDNVIAKQTAYIANMECSVASLELQVKLLEELRELEGRSRTCE